LTEAMGNPKQKFGKSRTRKRRANWKAEPVATTACPECGHYRGRAAVAVSE